jgi:uncharacterized protein (TIRG00374 family)
MKLALRLAITAGVLAALLWWIGDEEASGIEKISGVVLGAGLWGVALAFAFATLDRALMRFKWKLLLHSRNHEIGFLRGMQIYCSSLVWGLFLPSTVGADALRGALTIRAGLPADAVFTSIVVERMVGFLCSLVMSLIGLSIVSTFAELEGPWASLWWMGVLALLGTLGGAVLSFNRNAFAWVFARIPERLRERPLLRTVQRLHESYLAYSSDTRTLSTFTGLTFVEIGVAILLYWSCALALHVEVSLLFVAGALPLSLLISRLPLSIDGIGVFEGAFAALLLIANVPESQAISIALLGRVVNIAAWLPWWLVNMYGSGRIGPPRSELSAP